MHMIEVVVAVLTLIGAGLSFVSPRPSTELGAAPAKQGAPYLVAFAAAVVVFGAFNLFYYRGALSGRADDVLFAVWLVLAMIAGMFVQVVAANYRARRALFSISRDRLVFPLLFSIVVFYPVWALAASSPNSFFAVHAAFLNGYFWESIVSAAKPPSAD
jgi:hypothetical protein